MERRHGHVEQKEAAFLGVGAGNKMLYLSWVRMQSQDFFVPFCEESKYDISKHNI